MVEYYGHCVGRAVAIHHRLVFISFHEHAHQLSSKCFCHLNMFITPVLIFDLKNNNIKTNKAVCMFAKCVGVASRARACMCLR